MLRAARLAVLVILCAASARAAPPRWRLRASLLQGFGGGRAADDSIAARFPTTIDLGARLWGPLSLAATVTSTLAGELDGSCGRALRPNAIAGALGLRADLANGRSAPWVDPWVEAHAGVGAEAGVHAQPGGGATAATFAAAGARAGIDVWLGKAAVTVAVAFDYLPLGATASFVLGASFVLF